MFRHNPLTPIFLLVFFLLISSCGKKEISLSQDAKSSPIEKNADVYNTQQSPSYKADEEAIQEESTNRRGLFSLFFRSSKKESDESSDNIKSKELKKEAFNNDIDSDTKKINTEQNSNNKVISENTNNSNEGGIIQNIVRFFRSFANDNKNIIKNIKYPEDSLSVEDGLNLAVLKIPTPIHKKEKNLRYSEDTKLLKSMPTTLPKNISLNIINDPIYVDIFGINSLKDNQLNKVNKQSNNEDLSPSDIYKNYFIALKFEGLLTNYNEVIPNKSITLLHKTLISQLLLKNGNIPQVLYIFYRQTNQDMSTSSEQQLYLTSYLNNLRAYIYSKKIQNLYLQEVQFTDLPVDEILLVLKPITIEQYNSLPKQVNIFNAQKVNRENSSQKNKNVVKKSNNKL